MSDNRVRILIIKTSALGDIVHCYPVLDYLKNKFPEAKIDWIVERRCAELVRSHPAVDQVFTIDSRSLSWASLEELLKSLRQTHYDFAFDLQGNIKSGLIALAAKAKIKVGFGYKTVAEWPNILFNRRRFNPPPGKNIRSDYLYLVQRTFNDMREPPAAPLKLRLTGDEEKQLNSIKTEGAILVCPGAQWKNKRLPLDLLVEHLEGYPSEQKFLILWGSDEEQRFAQSLVTPFGARAQLLPKLSLPTLQNLMARVQRVIAMDSLPLHLAGTTATPTTSFFGPSSLKKYLPYGEHHKGFQGHCPYGITFEKRCPKLRTCPTGACMKSDRG